MSDTDAITCDICSKDYTESTVSGGFIFGTHAYCPECAALAILHIVKNREDKSIRAVCPPGLPFRDFVRNYREGAH